MAKKSHGHLVLKVCMSKQNKKAHTPCKYAMRVSIYHHTLNERCVITKMSEHTLQLQHTCIHKCDLDFFRPL